jgi:3-oxoacyl-[acyl-carrier-protein] synthase II
MSLEVDYQGIKGRRVAVTAVGAVTPLAHDAEGTFRAMVEARSGIAPITTIDPADLPVTIGAEVKDFDPTEYFSRKEANQLDRFSQFALVAAKEALGEQYRHPYAAERIGVVFGSGIGGIMTLVKETQNLLEKGSRAVSPRFIPMMISNMAAGELSIRYGLEGANYIVTTACASATHAIGEAFRNIAYGHLDACLTGGTEAPITPVALAGFANMRALSKASDPALASLPFDKRRQGFVIGEGAVVIMLEAYDLAQSRGARIIGEVLGYGATADAYHMTSPDPEGRGAARAMALALKEAGVAPEDVGYINAHGTGTPLNDKYETLAIKLALGDEIAKNVPVSSTKGVTGHLLGAAGGVEALACLFAMRDGIIPPTAGLNEPDEDCDLDCVPLVARKKDISVSLSNSLGFGGHNGTLVFGKGV